MNRRLLYIIIYIAGFISLSACHRHDLPEPQEKARRTVIVYMMAENTLSRFAYYDSTEMAKATLDIPADCNLLLYKDDASLPTITRMNSETGNKLWKKYKYDQDSADSTVMLRTLTELVHKFPSEHYALVLWSHASGWIPKRKTIGVDNNRNSSNSNFGTEMNITTLRGVLEQLPHMDFILFDACDMQNIEVAHELRNTTDYIIGSPSEIPGNGAPYDRIMSAMMQGDAIEIAEQYYQHYENGAGVALSVVDCSMIDSLAEITAPLIEEVWSRRKSIDTDNIQYYVPFESTNKPDGQDIRGMLHSVLPDSTYQQWEKTLLQAIPWHKATNSWTTIFRGSKHCTLTDPDHYSGLSMFVPQEKYEPYGWNEAFRQTSWYQAARWDRTGW